MALEVNLQRTLAYECLRAQVASKRPLPRVPLGMQRQGVLPEELGIAHSTGERPLSRVRSYVALQMPLVFKPQEAQDTLVHLGAEVGLHVLDQRGVQGKLLAARAAPWLEMKQAVAHCAVLVGDGEAADVAAEDADSLQRPRGLFSATSLSDSCSTSAGREKGEREVEGEDEAESSTRWKTVTQPVRLRQHLDTRNSVLREKTKHRLAGEPNP